ncbi:hypothetical protein [Oceanobacillus alkalisoli]|uniref:hypothetical protein n=1 Tax=Oceanobacillus alkalisoli TaxID=2925113 RepID=UPI001F119870|nr:hypothetical protein [Oceanobacillus alkalisoli]MCF3942189.1 hypothetical protein [Oceanobacillus alkalisoli]
MIERDYEMEFIHLKLDDFAEKAIEAKQLTDQTIVRKTIEQLLKDILETQNALEDGVYPNE